IGVACCRGRGEIWGVAACLKKKTAGAECMTCVLECTAFFSRVLCHLCASGPSSRMRQSLSPRVGSERSATSSCFFSSRRRHTRFKCDWSSDVCSSDLTHTHTHTPPNEPLLPGDP